MTNTVKKFAILNAAGLMLLSSGIPVLAAEEATPKEEVIYALLRDNGTVEDMYAVNILKPVNGEIQDYGNYSSIRNMTTQDGLEQSGKKITGKTTADKLYYEGTLAHKELPWTIQISYKLDGKEIEAKELAGKDGKLQIHLSLKENPNGDQEFFEHYALQATLLLDTEKAKNIQEEGATVANVGKKKQYTYTILPGQEKEIDLEADVTDFEMDAIAINGVKLSLDVDVDTDELSEKIAQLKEGVSELDNGAGQLNDGTQKVTTSVQGPLQNGVKDLHKGTSVLQNGTGEVKKGGKELNRGAQDLAYGSSTLAAGLRSLNQGIQTAQAGIEALNAKSPELVNGSKEVKDALAQIQGALNGLSVSKESVEKLTAASGAMKQGIHELAAGAASLQQNVQYASYLSAMKQNGADVEGLKAKNSQAAAQLAEQTQALKAQIEKLNGQEGTEEVVAGLNAQLETLNSLSQLLQANNAVMGGTEAYFAELSKGAASLSEGAKALQGRYSEFDQKIQELGGTLEGMLVQLSQLKQGIQTLAGEYGKLDAGIQAYTQGVAELASGYQDITKGSTDLVDGSQKLKAGSQDLASGTNSLVGALDKVDAGAQSVSNGAGSLDDGLADLIFALNQLKEGSGRLSAGTSEMKSETDHMDTELEEQVDELLASVSGDDQDPKSFVDEENEHVSSVQFVIKTDPIEKEEAETPTEETEKTSSFFQKLKDLFKKESNQSK